jgi:hypothetical protein
MAILDMDILRLKTIIAEFEKNDIERVRILARLNYTIGDITAVVLYLTLLKTSLWLLWPTIKLVTINAITQITSYTSAIGTSSIIVAGSVSSITGVVVGVGTVVINNEINTQPEEVIRTTGTPVKEPTKHIPENIDRKIPEPIHRNMVIQEPAIETVTVTTISGEKYTGIMLNRNEDFTFLKDNSGNNVEIRNEEILELLFNGD